MYRGEIRDGVGRRGGGAEEDECEAKAEFGQRAERASGEVQEFEGDLGPC